jgi:hypothetical protein
MVGKHYTAWKQKNYKKTVSQITLGDYSQQYQQNTPGTSSATNIGINKQFKGRMKGRVYKIAGDNSP